MSVPAQASPPLRDGVAEPPPRWELPLLLLLAFALYAFINPHPAEHFDYTQRIAEALLRGELGLTEKPPPWLNEFVPFQGRYYSVFPLGSVLTMVPFVLVEQWTAAFSVRWIVGLCALAAAWFLHAICRQYDLTASKRVLLCAAFLFGTWMWPNLAYGGAWQLALGWATVGLLGAIFFSAFHPRPFWAGAFFALAFGNRTELLLLAPWFLLLLCRQPAGPRTWRDLLRTPLWKTVALFSAVPFVLGVATLLYNAWRFGSPTDFGYARIPGVLEEPWYHDGIFSRYYWRENFREMLLRLWKPIGQFPWFVPTGFGGAIWLHSPFLFLALRGGQHHAHYKVLAWTAIGLITLVLWLHGNPGGWQVSYRYAIPLLPWFLLLVLESSAPPLNRWEQILFSLSIGISALSTWIFLRTGLMSP